MTVQVHDLKYISLPVGWDATYLKNYAMADGITFDRVVGDINQSLAMFNSEQKWYDNFIAITDQPEVEYPQGNLSVEDHTEYTPPKPQRTDFTGHMLPVLEKDLGYRFTRDFFVKGRFSRVQGSVRAGIDAFRQHQEYMIIKRALQRADDSGASKGLGTSGISPGFATTAANTGVDYIPPRYAGQTFLNTHEHYLSYAAASLATGIGVMINHLREHGHVPPYELWISDDDAATVGALTGFVNVTPVTQMAGTSSNQTVGVSAQLDVPYYLGSYKECYVRVIPRMPQYYYFMSKPYGFNDMRNPFRMRFDPRWGAEGVMLMATDPSYPLSGAYLFEAKGVGVGEDRTNGVAMFIDAGATWADATVT
jgi:hypothetical protein